MATKRQCYLNGEFVALADARISVLDRGFLFGDGIYEVVPIYRRQLFHWQRHLNRLDASLDKIRLPFNTAALMAPIQRLIAECEDDTQALYIQITRGAAAVRQQKPPPGLTPTIFMMTNPRPKVAAKKLRDGVSAVTMEDFRWRRGDIKSVSLLAAVLIADQADSEGSEEAVLLRDGMLTEGASSNFIVVHGKTLSTPILDNRLLDGITCQVVLELAQQAGYQIRRQEIAAAALKTADELWLTSSLREMLPVTHLDNAPVGGNGVPGAVFREVYAALQAHIKTYEQ